MGWVLIVKFIVVDGTLMVDEFTSAYFTVYSIFIY